MFKDAEKWNCELTVDGKRIAYFYVGHHKIIFKYDGKHLSLSCVMAGQTRHFEYTDSQCILSKKETVDGILDILCLPGIDMDSFLWVSCGIVAPYIRQKRHSLQLSPSNIR